MITALLCDTDGIRLDVFISNGITDYTRSFFNNLIAEGCVSVNSKKITKSGFKLSSGDMVEVDIPDPVDTDIKPVDIPLDIVYEDDHLIVINKPQGMVVHPALGHYDDTLVNALLYHCKDRLSDINGVLRPGIVHRIDKDTSGLMLAVKDNETHVKMAEMIAKHEVIRQYRALVYGVVSNDEGMIDAPIGRSDKDRRKMAVIENGKESVTHFKVIQRYTEATDLSLLLETGRTHQIRAHMTFIGHPVLGDPLYASKRKNFGLNGQCLHSKSIEFVHPITGERMFFESELPDYYKDVLSGLVLL